MEKPTEAERERAATLDRNRLATAAREALLLVDDLRDDLQTFLRAVGGWHIGADHGFDALRARRALQVSAERRDAIVARMLAPSVSDGR